MKLDQQNITLTDGQVALVMSREQEERMKEILLNSMVKVGIDSKQFKELDWIVSMLPSRVKTYSKILTIKLK